MKRGYATIFDFVIDGLVIVRLFFGRGPDDAVAAVVFFNDNRHTLIRKKHQVDMVFFFIGGHVLWVYPYPFACDESFQLVFYVVEVGARDNLISNQKELSTCPVVKFIFNSRLINK